MARLVPKGCSIHRIEIESGGADVGFRCASSAEDQAYVNRGYKRTRDTISQTYPSRFVKGVREVALGGAYVSGHGSYVTFNLPGPSNCKVERSGPRKAIRCAFRTGSPSGFDGYRRRSRRRRRS